MGSVPAPAGRRTGSLAVALVVAMWSIASQPMFLDDYEPNHPPFASQLRFLINAVQRPSWDLWIPRN